MIRRINRLLPACAVLSLLAGTHIGTTSAKASSDPASAPASPSVLTLRGPGGSVRSYAVSDATRKQSDATRLRAVSGRPDLASLKAANLHTPVTINARLLVTGTAQAALRDLLGVHQATLSPIGGTNPLPGAFVIEATSIAQASELADLIADSGMAESVEMDIIGPVGSRGGTGSPAEFNSITQWTLGDGAFGVSWPNANVNDAWAMGYTGAGIVVGVVDEGMRRTHEDLAANFLLEASDPTPINEYHATAVAGVIAMASNGLGGAGVAYNAQVSDHHYSFFSWEPAIESMLRRNDLNDVKNNSWGPADTGTISNVPQALLDAIETATTEGRAGLGTVLVWAAGNGAEEGDRCDYDPLASDRHTICIGAVGDGDRLTSYSEPGACLHAVTYSSGTGRGVYTTSVSSDSSYASQFGYTSAAAPLASGIVALMLEANPSLSARDVMHIIVGSARKVVPAHPDWTTNGAGHDINHWFGFGAVDAFDAVTLAQAWTGTSPEVSVQTPTQSYNEAIPDDGTPVTHTFSVSEDITLEHVELRISVDSTEVGPIRVELVSPQGTTSVLADVRDDLTDGYQNRRFTTARCWDESSQGDWTLRVTNTQAGFSATLLDAGLTLYGTSEACSDADLAEPLGTLDIDDVLAFLSAFALQAEAADLAPPQGSFDIDDVLAFLSAFASGCP